MVMNKLKLGIHPLCVSFQLLDHILERLRSRLEHILGQLPLDLDYLEFISTQ